MFPQIDTLPGSQLEVAVAYRHRDRAARQNVSAMRRHVVITFAVVSIGGVAVGRPAQRQRFKIPAHRRIGIFGKNDRATRVQNKNIDQTGFDVRSADDLGDLSGDFRRSPTVCGCLNGLLVRHVLFLRLIAD